MKKLICRKAETGFAPETARDAEILKSIPTSAVVTLEVRYKSYRSLPMHRMYWALIQLAMDYWEPSPLMIDKIEKEFSDGLLKFLSFNGVEVEAMEHILSEYCDGLAKHRTLYVSDQPKSLEMLHQWVKEKVGLYELMWTPDGIVKRVKSISFDSMDHEEWKEFYRDAFSVIWDLILRSAFERKEDAQDAINQLMQMGSAP